MSSGSLPAVSPSSNPDLPDATSGLRLVQDISAPRRNFFLSNNSTKPDAVRLLHEFIGEFLGIPGLVIGFQSRFGLGCDLILFYGDNHTTLAIPCDVMLLDQYQAQQTVQTKIEMSRKAFEGQQ